MQFGDFTDLAKFYVNGVGYSLPLLRCIASYVKASQGEDIKVADIGAGTGKLTEDLSKIGLSGSAVEPNDAMRSVGMEVMKDDKSFSWSKGAAEGSGLPDSCVDWVLMGSSFHWTDAPRAVAEFKRILKPGGYFTAIWNPRDIKRSELHIKIEDIVYRHIPGMKRVSSGGIITTDVILEKLGGSRKLSHELIFMEARHDEKMTKERYMNIWRSVNDIRVQAGEEGFAAILADIEDLLRDMDELEVPYLSRAWTVKLG